MNPSTALPAPSKAWAKWLAALLPLLMLGLCLAVLRHALQGYHLHDVMRHLGELPWRALLAAAVLALASYLVLGAYDILALRYVQQAMHPLRALAASFVAFAVGHTMGFASLTGGAIRMRWYGAAGITATRVALMSAFCAWTTLLGSALLIAWTLSIAPQGASALLHVSPNVLRVIAALLWLVLSVYVGWTFKPRTLSIRQWSLPVPGFKLTLAQTVVAAVDLILAAGCLYVLLPVLPTGSALSFQAFLSIYVLSTLAILVTNVPGGLGVLESLMILALPELPVDRVLAALLAYRAIYYIAPLLLAAALMAGHEVWLLRHHVKQVTGQVAGVLRGSLSTVAPQVMGAAVFVAGGVLLLSGATPAIHARLQWFSDVLPLPVVELSHLLGSITGIGLVVLSHALFRRVELGWRIAVALLLAGAVFSLLKGFDYEEASIMLVVALSLLAVKPAFYRRAALFDNHLNAKWLGAVLLLVVLMWWMGFLAHRRVPYSHDLWLHFSFLGDASRMLRASVAVCAVLAGILLYIALSPAAPASAVADPKQMAAAQRIVQQATRAAASLAMVGDKRLLMHPAGDAFVMYQITGRSWIAMSDPMVAADVPAAQASERAYELAWSFRELSDQHGGRAVFYQVTPEYLPLYLDLGLSLLKLGEEARVSLPEFSLEGSHRGEFRTARRRAEREGVTFEVIGAPLASTLVNELGVISSDWLAAKSAHEKRFSVGCFAPDYVSQFPVALARVNGRIVAFANLWPTFNHEELSVDMMRYASDAPKTVMDYLFVEIMLWAKAQGYRWFNLGMAPLSGLEQHPLATTWHRVGNFVFDVGGHFYNFEGLRRYKEKFNPQWEPRYLAAPGGLTLPWVLLDATSLIAGGLREIVSK